MLVQAGSQIARDEVEKDLDKCSRSLAIARCKEMEDQSPDCGCVVRGVQSCWRSEFGLHSVKKNSKKKFQNIYQYW
jgi:hypothetical protein